MFNSFTIYLFSVDGGHSVPAEEKWKAVFEECWSRLGCETSGQGVYEKAWENIAISLTARRRQQKDQYVYTCKFELCMKMSLVTCVCVCSLEELSQSQNKMLESLEIIPKHVAPITADSYNKIRCYLMKVRLFYFS